MTFAHNLGLLILRLGLGSVGIAHGGQELFEFFGGSGIGGIQQAVSKMGISTGNAPLVGMPWNEAVGWLVGIGEFFGGCLIVLGVLPRLASFFTAVIFGGAVYYHWKTTGGEFFLAQRGFEYPMTILAMSLTVLLLGAGRFALWPKG